MCLQSDEGFLVLQLKNKCAQPWTWVRELPYREIRCLECGQKRGCGLGLVGEGEEGELGQ